MTTQTSSPLRRLRHRWTGPALAGLLLAACPPTGAAPDVVVLRNDRVSLTYDLRAGTATLAWRGGTAVSGFHAEARVGARTVRSRDYPRRTPARRGNEVVITLFGEGLPVMRQRFTLRPNGALLKLEVSGEGLSSNRMAPLVAEGANCLDLGKAKDARALRVPFDNDQWARYRAEPLRGSGTSYEVAAFYDNGSRHGLVVGSVTHDTWKTGIEYEGEVNPRRAGLKALRVFGGIADAQTRDAAPHGAVTGQRIVSPTIMVAGVSDWRDGLEEFAGENAARAPMLKWTSGVPFGWNSWGKVQKRLDYDKAIAMSNVFAGGLLGGHFRNDGTTYINLDSYWDNLSDVELRRFVAHARANGQKAGIYWAPFVYWGDDLSRRVEDGSATFGDMALRAPDGAPLKLDGAFALDPTHPATIRRNKAIIARFRAAGFEYIKLDFLTHGALEGGSRGGRHHDPQIQTGIQAYHSGMKGILKQIGGSMFISASIAPLFPHGYAHARRVSCDTYGGIGETEYVMNSIAYGWWISGRLYAYNDPDHLVLEGYSPDENMSRVTSGAIAGTVFLNGDDVTRPAARRRVRAFLANADVNNVARMGRAFRPVEGNTGDRAVDALVLKDGNTTLLALMNYRKEARARKEVNLARAGLDAGAEYRVTDLWTGRSWPARETLALSLRPAQGTILRLTPVRRTETAGTNRTDRPRRSESAG